MLMVFTVIEVGAVYMELEKYTTWVILISVGIIKVFGIAGWFMHLRGDPFIFTKTAVFPLFFVALMIYGIGLSNPGGVDDFPSWCLPPWAA
jgi:hypothetical protein